MEPAICNKFITFILDKLQTGCSAGAMVMLCNLLLQTGYAAGIGDACNFIGFITFIC